MSCSNPLINLALPDAVQCDSPKFETEDDENSRREMSSSKGIV